jgi:hypothetical protein
MLQIKRSRMDQGGRYVFLCPTALNKHFDHLPDAVKDSAVCVFKCSRAWAFQDQATLKRGPVQSKIDCGGKSPRRSPGEERSSVKVVRPEFSQGFLEWLEACEAEARVFWYKPERDLSKLSSFLEALMDPVTGSPYQPLLLDSQWWRVRFKPAEARFCHAPARVVASISASSREGSDELDLVALQELIYQSNPTLAPIIQCPNVPVQRFVPKSDASRTLQSPRTNRSLTQANSRIVDWPLSSKIRLDDLHVRWQLEDSVWTRHNVFQSVARSFLDSGSSTHSAR